MRRVNSDVKAVTVHTSLYSPCTVSIQVQHTPACDTCQTFTLKVATFLRRQSAQSAQGYTIRAHVNFCVNNGEFLQEKFSQKCILSVYKCRKSYVQQWTKWLQIQVKCHKISRHAENKYDTLEPSQHRYKVKRTVRNLVTSESPRDLKLQRPSHCACATSLDSPPSPGGGGLLHSAARGALQHRV